LSTGINSGLSVRDLSVAYDGHVVLDDVSIDCGHGEIVGLLGPNGAGKSTLLKAIVGLVDPSRGEVELDGQTLGHDKARRSRVAYVPQRNDVDWDFPLTVEDVVLLGRQGRLGLFGRPGREDRQAAAEALERLGMGAERKALIGELSGGQQQRVFLARALAQGGDVLLLDEPLTGVDATTQVVVLELLAELRDRGQAILVSTHDLAQAAEVCDRLCLLNGRVMAFGTPAEVMTTDTLVRTYGSGAALPHALHGHSHVGLPHDAGPVADHDHGEPTKPVTRRGH
jgi:ABC-type Mn2+/Zn2+ transport system ATPase subunit